MDRWKKIGKHAVWLIACVFLTSCQSSEIRADSVATVTSTVPQSSFVPGSIKRLAVFYPKASMKALADAYLRLEGATFQLKEERPSLKIVERVNLSTIREELRLQSSGVTSDESAIRLGQILGVDGILVYHISCSSPTSQLLSRFSGVASPISVMSKILSVETGEVLYDNVVTTQARDFSPFRSYDLKPLQLLALDRGMEQTITDLRHAFRMPEQREEVNSHGTKTIL